MSVSEAVFSRWPILLAYLSRIMSVSIEDFGRLLAVVVALRAVCLISSCLATISISTALLIALFAAYAFHEIYWKRRKLPPGPVPWLVLGNMPLILKGQCIYDLWLSLKQQYGPVFTFWIGPIPLVMVCDCAMMKEYFVKYADVFSGRWRNFVTDSFMGGANGVVQIDGEKWREQRRFALHVLRDFGFGRDIMETKVMKEVDALVECLSLELGNQSRCVLDLSRPLSVSVGNIINSALFGYRFSQDSPLFFELQKALDRQSALVVQPIMGAYIVAPWSRHVPGLRGPWQRLMKNRDVLWSFLISQVEEHKKDFDPSIDAPDFTFAYLKEMHRRKENGYPMGHFSEWQLTMLLLDLWFAGMETTITTLKWGFLFMMLNPKVQEKIHKELDEQCPEQEAIAMADRTKLPYTTAAVNEIQRMANILPVNLLRTASETKTMGPYTYEQGTLVIPQISVALFDPVNFCEPQKFDPSRFLEADGKTLKKVDGMLPFSVGKRQCLGESLARVELFMIFANLMHKFRFSVADGQSTPSLIRKPGLTVSPQKYLCQIERRS
uniref:Cytochrome P450 n=1 Tax=Plectus sambesii TaxID=2011161 RepID=A0A914WG22_9BILA